MENFLIILAAGKGSRFYNQNSDFSKLMIPILDQPIIEYVVDSIKEFQFKNKIMVVGHNRQQIIDYFQDYFEYVIQEKQLGTGHAIKLCKDKLKSEIGYTLILNGDMPNINKNTIREMKDLIKKKKADAIIATATLDNPESYGRIIKNKNSIKGIKEFKDCNKKEKLIKEINVGIYLFNNQLLFKYIDKINNKNKQNEFYLPDIVSLMVEDNHLILPFHINNNQEIIGVNNPKDFSQALHIINHQNNIAWLEKGVTIFDSNSTFISKKTSIEPPITIYPNTFIKGKSTIASNSFIGPNSEIFNSDIGICSKIEYSIIRDSIVGNHSTIGPYAHIRQNSILSDKVKVGNFVEIKKTKLGENTKSSHHAYLGDSSIGDNVNIGCGVITANYDGVKKHQTVINDQSFIGCNSTLIAPVIIGENSYIAAGSTINVDVPSKSLAIARQYQVNKLDYVDKLRRREKT